MIRMFFISSFEGGNLTPRVCETTSPGRVGECMDASKQLCGNRMKEGGTLLVNSWIWLFCFFFLCEFCLVKEAF